MSTPNPFAQYAEPAESAGSDNPFAKYAAAEQPASEAPKPKRSLVSAINDTVIEAANAAAGTASAVGNFVRPGNAASGWIDKNIVQAGEAAQSDVIKAEKARYADEMQNAQGIGDEVGATLGYVARNPLLAAAQAAGSFAGPGLAVKGAGALATAAGATAKGASRAGLAAGAGLGAAGAGGDAAGTAYELSREGGATDEQAVAAARGASVIPAAIGAAGGLVGAERLLAGAKGFGGGLVSRALKTGAVEAGQEAIEEGVTQYEGQRAAVPFNADIDPMKGVAGAATMGAVLGGVTGAGTSLLTGQNQQPMRKPSENLGLNPENGPLSKAAAAAVDAAAAAQPQAEPQTQVAPVDGLSLQPTQQAQAQQGPSMGERLDALPQQARTQADQLLREIADERTPEGVKRFRANELQQLLDANPMVQAPSLDIPQEDRFAMRPIVRGFDPATGQAPQRPLGLVDDQFQYEGGIDFEPQPAQERPASLVDLASWYEGREQAGDTPSNPLEQVQQQVRQSTPYTDAAQVQAARQAVEDAWLALNAGAASDTQQGEVTRQSGASDAAGAQADTTAETDARVRAGRVSSAVRNAFDGNPPNTLAVIQYVNQGLSTIGEQQLTSAEIGRIRRLADARATFEGLNQPAPLPADRLPTPTPVDAAADNSGMEALIPERTARTSPTTIQQGQSNGSTTPIDNAPQTQQPSTAQGQASGPAQPQPAGGVDGAQTPQAQQAGAQQSTPPAAAGQAVNGVSAAVAAPAGAAGAVNDSTPAAARPRTAGDRARAKSYDANPMRAFLGKHGVRLDARSEFAPGLQEMRGALVPGYGPIFRNRGKPMDTLVQNAIEEGFLPQGASESDLYDLIDAAVRRGQRVDPMYAADTAEQQMQAEYERRMQLEREAYEAQQAADAAEDAAYEAVLAQEFVGLTEQEYAALEASVPALDAPSNTSLEDAMRALGFTEQEIQDAVAQQSTVTPEGGQRTDQAGTTEPRSETARDGESQGDALQSYTADEVKQRQAAQEKAEADAAKAEREAQTKDKAERERKEIAARQAASAENFQLGQDPMDGLTGQGSIFDAPLFSRNQSQANSQANSQDGPRDLYLGHNISLEGLRHALALGGLAAPSLGISRTSTGGFTGYGDITLIADKDMIGGRDTPTFDSDVYSPRQPRARLNVIVGKMRALMQRVHAAVGSNGFYLDEVDLSRRGAEMIASHDDVKMMFLQEQGIPFTPPKLKIDADIRRIVDVMRKPDDSDVPFAELPQVRKIAQQRVDAEMARLDGKDGIDQQSLDRLRKSWYNEDGTVKDRYVENLIGEARRHIQNNGIDRVEIRAALAKKLRPKEVSAKYDAWVQALLDSVTNGKVLVDGRKSKPYTLENVVQAMTQKLRGGEGTNYGAGNIRAMYAKKLGSVADAQKHRDRIVSKADFEKYKKQSHDGLFELLEELKPYYRFDANGWGYADDASQAIAEGEKGLREAFNLDAQARAKINGYIDYLKSLPTEYFEMKVQRAMDLSEFKGAVVPSDTPKDLIAALQDKGIKVAKYSKSEGARAAAIGKFKDSLFSRGEQDAAQAPDLRYSTATKPATKPAAVQLRRTMVQRTIDSLSANWSQRPPITVVDSMADPRVPQAVREADQAQRSQGATGEPEGFWYRGQAYLVASALSTSADATRVLYHEVLGHHGLRGHFGKDLDRVLDQVSKLRRKDVEAKAKEYGLDMGNAVHVSYAAEEVLAELAQTRPDLGFVQRAIAAIRNFLRSHVSGFKALELTDADIVQGYLLPARGWVERGGVSSAAKGAANFARSQATSQTQTEAFKRWFGDSKVVDAEGNPLVVYHGSGTEFDAFDINRLGSNTGYGDAETGFHFADNRADADFYATMAGEKAGTDGVVREFYLSLQNPLIVGMDESDGNAGDRTQDFLEDKNLAKEYALDNGHDGIIYLYGTNVDSGYTAIAFRPEQIKSATSNNGDFDAANPDIRYSRSQPAAAIASSMGQMTADQERAYRAVAGFDKVPTLQERFDSFKANMGLRMKQALVDQFAPIAQVDQNAYMLARMSKGSDGTLEAALLYGRPFLRDGVPDVDVKEGGFAKVLAGLNGEHDRFLMWVAAQRAEGLKAQGKENLFSDQDITSLKTLNDGQMQDGSSRKQAYVKALSQLNSFNESVLRMAKESGLIDQDAYDLMKDQPYVPFYRLMEEEGGLQGPSFSKGLTNQKAWKKLKGGTEQLNADLLQNMLLNWGNLYAASARNRAALATMDAADKMAIAYKVPSDTKGAAKVMRDGMTEHWLVEDPYLLEAISALNYQASPLMKPLTKAKQWLTIGVTVNPTFKVRNLIRDVVSSMAMADLSYNPAANVAKGWKLTARDSQVYASMLASGGVIKFGTQEQTDRARSQVAKLSGVTLDQTGAKKLWGQIKSLYEVYDDFGDRTENINRAALYDRLIAKGHSHAEASFMARDLMDFSMGGSAPVVRFLTQSVPFLNARLQGLYKLGRAAKEDPRRFATVAMAVSVASLGLMAAYADDEDWKRREDWDRDSYWWFKIGDTAYRIPKPFEVGAIGTLAERTFEAMFDDEMDSKRFMERISHMVSQTFAFDPVPQAFKPLLDIYANKDSFTGRAIESQSDQRLRPEDRYNERTSEVARMLGQFGLPDPAQLVKGEYTGLSPKQIDHLLRGYFSWMATAATTASDYLVRPALDRGDRPEARLKDMFLVGNFAEQLPSGGSRYVSAMYEQSRAVEQAFASYRDALTSGDLSKAGDIMDSSGDLIRSRAAVSTATKLLAQLNTQAKRVEADTGMSASEKRDRLNQIEQRRHEIAQRVNGRAAT